MPLMKSMVRKASGVSKRKLAAATSHRTGAVTGTFVPEGDKRKSGDHSSGISGSSNTAGNASEEAGVIRTGEEGSKQTCEHHQCGQDDRRVDHHHHHQQQQQQQQQQQEELGRYANLHEELLALRGEVEPISSRRSSQSRAVAAGEAGSGTGGAGGGTVTYRPTYRAILAKHNYLVRKTLGNGSYSKVKLAISLARNKEAVAVKIVDRNRAPSDFQTKFLPRELDVWPRLRHPNIVRVLDTFDDGRRVYMVLDYQENGDVLRYIQKVGALNEPLAQSWTWQVCDAARYLHDQNITHRDLKLENLLLDRNFHIKICDFGFVKGDCLMDLSRTYCGSKSYAAPEILKGEPYDPKKADTWAIGVILYIFITGKMPFDESRGNAGVLDEQRRLEFPWRKYKKVTPDERELVLRLFTFEFRMRPDIHAVLVTPWMKHAARADMSDLRDMAMEGYRHRKEREKEREREREREQRLADKSIYSGGGGGGGGTHRGGGMGGRTHSM